MQTNNIETRVATSDEVSLLLSWAQNEGWNPGLHDTDLFYETDQSGFFVTLLDETPVAGISVVKLNLEHAFLGLYLCKPEHRGKGYGMQTWSTAIKSVGTRSIGLDGVVAQQSNYLREHFVYSHRNVRFAGTLSDTQGSDKQGSDNQVSDNPRSDSIHSGSEYKVLDTTLTIVDASHVHLNALVLYDADVGGIKRDDFYRAWLTSCDSRQTFIALVGDHIAGIIGIRQCVDGYKVGPWIADDQTIAQALFSKIPEHIGNETLMVDVPDSNQIAMHMMKQLNLSPVFETARMYRGQPPVINTEKLFGVATLELG